MDWTNPHPLSVEHFQSFQLISSHWICCLFEATEKIQGRNNVTRKQVESRLRDQDRRKNDAVSSWPRCQTVPIV